MIDRAEIAEAPSRPLLSERWAGCVDAVGSATLAHVLAEVRYGGAVAACGLAGGNDLPTTVVPFLLRGVTLYGIDSVMCPAERRAHVWRRAAELLDLDRLEAMTSEVTLDELPRSPTRSSPAAPAAASSSAPPDPRSRRDLVGDEVKTTAGDAGSGRTVTRLG